MKTIAVEGNTFELIAESRLHQHDWILQVETNHQGFFDFIKGRKMTFILDNGRVMKGFVLKTTAHTLNLNKPQLQVQIRENWLLPYSS